MEWSSAWTGRSPWEANKAIRETLISLEFQSREECYYHVGSRKEVEECGERDITFLNVGATSV